jgi:hypothetical protein
MVNIRFLFMYVSPFCNKSGRQFLGESHKQVRITKEDSRPPKVLPLSIPKDRKNNGRPVHDQIFAQ